MNMDFGFSNMVPWWWLIVFFVLGGMLGVAIMALMFTAKKSYGVMIRNIKYRELDEPLDGRLRYKDMYDGLGDV